MDDKRLTYLLEAYLDATISPAETEELNRRLIESEPARRQYWEQMSLHGLTQEAVRLEWLGAAAPEFVQRQNGLLAGWSWFLQFPVWLRVTAAAGAAALLLWGAFFSGASMHDRPVASAADPGVALLAHAASAVWADSRQPVQTGAVLMPGSVKLEEGIVQIDFYSGARVILEGPAELQLISRSEAVLKSGKLSCQVSEQARGFKITAGGVDVVDLGTAFGVKVASDGAPEVHVIEGKVVVSTQGSKEPARELVETQAMRVSASRFTEIPFAQDDFTSAKELRRREAAEASRSFESWKVAADELSLDPATLLHYTFDRQPVSDSVLRNHAVQTGDKLDGAVIGCRWSDGRWPGKEALDFRGHGDRVLLNVPGEYPALTLMTWVRVDGLFNKERTLLLTEPPERWDVRKTIAPSVRDAASQRRRTALVQELEWTLSEKGEMYLGLKFSSPPKSTSSSRHHHSPVVIRPNDLGRWVCLATVYDTATATITHYFNGEKVSSLKLAYAPPVLLDYLELGNFGGCEKDQRRNFFGTMDELCVQAKCMSGEEIRRYYQLGRPGAGPSPATVD